MSADEAVVATVTTNTVLNTTAGEAFVVVPPTGKLMHRGKVVRFDGCSMRDWNAMLAHRNVDPPHPSTLPRIGEAEIRTHSTSRDLWMVVRGIVYDCTMWGRFHPGGLDTLMEAAGRDATELFERYHRWVACDVMMAPYAIGVYDPRVTSSSHAGDGTAEHAASA